MWNVNKLKHLRDLDKDELLELIGLETRRTTLERMLPAVGLFGLGMLVGAAVGMLLAPKSGAQLRDDLRHRFQGEEPTPGAFPAEAGPPARAAKSL